MKKSLRAKTTFLKKEFFKNPFIYILLSVVLLLAFFVRVYRLDQLLGFYYDQGRDALVIWDLIHKGKFFLVGPTTGIEGIYRGPWYYWLITPFYFLGQGNPVWPAVFLAFTTVVAIFFLYKIGKIIGDESTGILATIIGSFSMLFVLSARWLSNPTPMFLISMFLIYFVYLVTKGKKWAWTAVGLTLGMAMQFGSAGEIFYFPAVLIFALTHKKYLPTKKIFVFSLIAFFITIIPQIIFDIRWHGVLSGNIKRFLVEKESFKLTFWEVIKIRSLFYYDIFVSKIFPANKPWGGALVLLLFTSLIINFKKLWKIEIFQIIFLLTFLPLFGMFFFQGNEGNVYDYYFTGYYFIYVLFTSVLVTNFLNGRAGAILISIFLLIFLSQNVPFIAGYLTSGMEGEGTIVLENQKKAIAWVYEDAKGKEFNEDAYVPPVISYAYDYLFKWYPTTLKSSTLRLRPEGLPGAGDKLTEKRVNLLYTLYEVDPPHPERLNAWLARQKGLGRVEGKAVFGGITVERRTRI